MTWIQGVCIGPLSCIPLFICRNTIQWSHWVDSHTTPPSYSRMLLTPSHDVLENSREQIHPLFLLLILLPTPIVWFPSRWCPYILYQREITLTSPYFIQIMPHIFLHVWDHKNRVIGPKQLHQCSSYYGVVLPRIEYDYFYMYPATLYEWWCGDYCQSPLYG